MIDAEQKKDWVLLCPRGCEEVLAEELRAVGIEEITISPTTLHVRATLQEGYRMAIWSRVASRVLLPLAHWKGRDDTALYDALRKIPWWEHFDVTQSFAISVSTKADSTIPGLYWSQRAKDAIVDAFRDRTGERPNVDKKNPSVRFHLYIGEGECEFALDFSGGGQHRRGYRHSAGQAPLKENLAAAILMLAGWPKAAQEGLTLLDPMCGSGTLLIEGALIATQCAPGLLRKRFGFEHWHGHQKSIFEAEKRAAERKRLDDIPAAIIGCDASEQALNYARENLRSAGIPSLVKLQATPLTALKKPADHGLLVCNPPYGHRLGEGGTLFLFYQQLGDSLKRSFDGWMAFVLAAQNDSVKHLGLRPARRHVLFNGAIECRLLEIPLHARIATDADTELSKPKFRRASEQAQALHNRLQKSRKKWERWAQKENIEAYRIYDADIPEYNVAIDRYADKAVVHIYSQTHQEDGRVAQRRIQDVMLTLPDALGIAESNIVVKMRQGAEQGQQHARLSQVNQRMQIREGDLKFWVELEEHLDTGLFMDHRLVRQYAQKNCAGKRMLNLFSYTSSVSLAAAVGGAAATTSVDLSQGYLAWSRENFVLNGLDLQNHKFIEDDVMNWLKRCKDHYDWIFINPPTFSHSKKVKGNFSVLRDHSFLIERSMKLLNPGGELLFTTHARKFFIDSELRKKYRVQEVNRQFVPEDFARSPFYAFLIRHR